MSCWRWGGVSGDTASDGSAGQVMLVAILQAVGVVAVFCASGCYIGNDDIADIDTSGTGGSGTSGVGSGAGVLVV